MPEWAQVRRKDASSDAPFPLESPPGGKTMAIAKDKLLEWRRLKAESSELGRQKKTIDDRLGQLEKEFEAELQSTGKDSIKRHGFTLAWVPGRATVPWASEFLRECGPEKTQALKDAAAQEAIKKLQIAAPSE